ncbi:hypothetical protein EJ05DRAFT_511908 [Pseudovirgaria hyperparasitica]|uniref:Pre-mRNA-splicing factor RSE1 n=1 Tax=Pseudovirgaria hyperparasitica TaxID=470096 RepID=A0A6A6W5G6_9PEZI|nr:uncharacterized protein EJ05DRAFT_511908 [Pseudovirgaria hyperparasitica]KAF2757180.1 hypothetical protein EJ05DRAFT_511908 [Pseudovirgaria hyperparasitica]
MATTSSMFMYSLSLVPSSAITQAIVGLFAGTKEQFILSASGSRLILSRLNASTGKLVTVLSTDTFSVIRSISTVRLAGSLLDYIVVTSDSGRITILEYIQKGNFFKRIHLETYGKSGVRRVIPGQYLAADPKGRALMIASAEKNKLVYVLNRNVNAELTISSPLEAHKHYALVFALIGVDVGYENPIFAALEIDYEESDQDPSGRAFEELEKHLVYYQLDLGLNHVVRKWTDTVDRTANMLFQVPGGEDGPSGVLVCAEESISYRHMDEEALRIPIPRRGGATEDSRRKRYITAGVMHKMRGDFFFLLQTEDGDLFKVKLITDEEDPSKKSLSIKYFDTVPLATALIILRSGFLFVASETGDHRVYQFEKLGDDDNETEWTSDQFSADSDEPMKPVYFQPRAYENITPFESVSCMNPMTGCRVTNLTGEDAPQIYTVSGLGARSQFKTLRHGLEVSEIVASDLPNYPSAVWTTKKTVADQYDAYIVLSFSNATLVLAVGETVEEATDTGFLTSAPTIGVQVAEDSIIQIHPRGIRQIRASGSLEEWEVPQHRTIVCATSNEKQVVVALSSGELIYFEVDTDSGGLGEYEERPQMSGTVTSLSLGDVPQGKMRSPFLAVGCDDSTVRILSVEPETCLESKSIQAVSASPTALMIMAMEDSSSGAMTLYLHIGLYSGVYLRTVVDEVTGDLSDTRTRFLGAKPVKLFSVTVQEQPAILALASRSWLGYSDNQSKAFQMTPLSYTPLEFGWNFSSEVCTEGIVGIEGQSVRIFTVDRLEENMIREAISLAHTPRAFVQNPEQALFYVGEADYNTLSKASRAKLLADEMSDQDRLPAEEFGYPRATDHWASCIEIVDPIEKKAVLETIHLEGNENICSITVAAFSSQDDESFLVVGTGVDVKVLPPSSKGGYIHIYRFLDEGRSLEFIHKTKVEEPPLTLLGFQGRLLAGVGNTLRIYELGMKQLLRKSQLPKAVPRKLVGLTTQGSRIICSDIQESVTYVVYKYADNRLISFCDDAFARWTTCTTMVDYETVAGGDKFGNVWLVRCPSKVSEVADEEGSGAHLVHEKGYLGGTSHRLDQLVHNFTQDIPTSIQKVSLVAGGRDIILWAGFQGTIGLLIPFASRDDVDFFQKLEMEMRSVDSPLTGRDHLIYRSYYVPVKGVIDGDLCERFSILKREVKERIAGELERTVREVERKIQDMRTRHAW